MEKINSAIRAKHDERQTFVITDRGNAYLVSNYGTEFSAAYAERPPRSPLLDNVQIVRPSTLREFHANCAA